MKKIKFLFLLSSTIFFTSCATMFMDFYDRHSACLEASMAAEEKQKTTYEIDYADVIEACKKHPNDYLYEHPIRHQLHMRTCLINAYFVTHQYDLVQTEAQDFFDYFDLKRIPPEKKVDYLSRLPERDYESLNLKLRVIKNLIEVHKSKNNMKEVVALQEQYLKVANSSDFYGNQEVNRVKQQVISEKAENERKLKASAAKFEADLLKSPSSYDEADTKVNVMEKNCWCYENGGKVQNYQVVQNVGGKSQYDNVTSSQSGKMVPCACR